MRKLFAALLALVAAASLSVGAFAASRGAAYIEDNGYYDEKVRQVAPGDTVYIALAEASNSDGFKIASNMVPTTAKITSAKTIGFIDDKDHKVIKAGNLDIEKLPVERGSEWYFAVLDIKNVDVKDYPEDGYGVAGSLKVTREGGSSFTIDLADSVRFIRFSEAENSDELTKQTQLYSFKSGAEIELEFPNGRGRFTGSARSSLQLLAGMSHASISAITKLDPNADMTFYLGNEAKFSNIRDAKLIIEAEESSYLYQIDSKNKLTSVSSRYYDEDEDAFVIETDVLGRYVVSDERLSTSGTASNSDDGDEYEYTYYEDDDDQDTDQGYVYVPPVNPSTGAKA